MGEVAARGRRCFLPRSGSQAREAEGFPGGHPGTKPPMKKPAPVPTEPEPEGEALPPWANLPPGQRVVMAGTHPWAGEIGT